MRLTSVKHIVLAGLLGVPAMLTGCCAQKTACAPAAPATCAPVVAAPAKCAPVVSPAPVACRPARRPVVASACSPVVADGKVVYQSSMPVYVSTPATTASAKPAAAPAPARRKRRPAPASAPAKAAPAPAPAPAPVATGIVNPVALESTGTPVEAPAGMPVGRACTAYPVMGAEPVLWDGGTGSGNEYLYTTPAADVAGQAAETMQLGTADLVQYGAEAPAN